MFLSPGTSLLKGFEGFSRHGTSLFTNLSGGGGIPPSLLMKKHGKEDLCPLQPAIQNKLFVGPLWPFSMRLFQGLQHGSSGFAVRVVRCNNTPCLRRDGVAECERATLVTNATLVTTEVRGYQGDQP